MARTSSARQTGDEQRSDAAGRRPARAAATGGRSGSTAARGRAAAGSPAARDGRPGPRAPEASRRFALEHGAPIAAEVARMARGRIAHARDELTGASGSPPDKAVHEARKDMKKLRALVRLVRPELGDELYRRENARFRDAARRLSDVRDADVMLTALESLERIPAAVARPLRAALAEHRGALEATLGAGGLDEARGEVAAALAEADRAVSDWPLRRDGFKAFAGGLERIYAQGRRRFASSLDAPSVENLHEWRKRVKDHWYHLTILEDLWRPPLDALADQAHVLSERLGDDHDLAVLRDWAHERVAGVDLAPLDEAIGRRRAELQADAVAIGRRLYGETAGAFSTRMRSWFEAWRAERPRAAA